VAIPTSHGRVCDRGAQSIAKFPSKWAEWTRSECVLLISASLTEEPSRRRKGVCRSFRILRSAVPYGTAWQNPARCMARTAKAISFFDEARARYCSPRCRNTRTDAPAARNRRRPVRQRLTRGWGETHCWTGVVSSEDRAARLWSPHSDSILWFGRLQSLPSRPLLTPEQKPTQPPQGSFADPALCGGLRA
jgi:hypothetical protein